ncbi:hypothetical protein EXS70_01955 [Candidatus Peribacteria bacterium]|nr:hypothetical protein [Candidatus Peribacteria bacterium]
MLVRKILPGVLVGLMAMAPMACFADDKSELTVQVVPRPSTSVPIGAQRVTMLTVRLTASCTRDIHLSSMTLHHKALGDPKDIERVYAVAGATRKTRTVPVTGSEGSARLHFRGMVVRACTTESLDILADFRIDAVRAGEHALAIDTREDVDADAPVKIVLNPAGSTQVTIPVGTPTGTVSAESLNLPGTLTYGSARTVARLRLRADARDMIAVTAITFVNDGTARGDDLQNFVLETSGHTRLAQTVLSLDGDHIRVVLDPPLVLNRNEVRLIQLLADIRASRRRTVRLFIQEPADIETAPAR